jgi:pilus assembly protein Flp/PilA
MVPSRGHRKEAGPYFTHTIERVEDALGGMDMILKLYTRFQTLTATEEGQDLLEYALLVALIALVCVGAVTLAGKNVNSIFGNVATQLGTAAGS